MTFKDKKRGKGLLIFLLFTVVFGGVLFIFISSMFERNKPNIVIKSNSYWNLKDPIQIIIDDDSGIKYYKVSIIGNKQSKVIEEKVIQTSQKRLQLFIKPPKFDMFFKAKDLKIVVEAVDNSKWNFFNGNSTIIEKSFLIDTKKPKLSVISNSRYIRRGGSAVVIVKVEDKNLVDKYILFNNIRFELTPFIKQNYYIALIAWDINIKFDDFDRVKLVAIDKANNKSFVKIPFYIQKLKIKKSNIKITDKFIENTSKYVLEQMDKPLPEDNIEIFLAQNNKLRKENIKNLRDVGIKSIPKDFIDDFKIDRFKRLPGSRTVSTYAELRSYFYNKEKIDEQWHLGYDFASVAHAKIRVSNKGRVIFNDYLGIYGNTIIIDHGLGLSSLYAHTSEQFVKVGDKVRKNQIIARTGKSGAVLGDHLHFGILVQGIEVNPLEWMDRNWIKTRILNVINNGKRQIK